MHEYSFSAFICKTSCISWWWFRHAYITKSRIYTFQKIRNITVVFYIRWLSTFCLLMTKKQRSLSRALKFTMTCRMSFRWIQDEKMADSLLYGQRDRLGFVKSLNKYKSTTCMSMVVTYHLTNYVWKLLLPKPLLLIIIEEKNKIPEPRFWVEYPPFNMLLWIFNVSSLSTPIELHGHVWFELKCNMIVISDSVSILIILTLLTSRPNEAGWTKM